MQKKERIWMIIAIFTTALAIVMGVIAFTGGKEETIEQYVTTFNSDGGSLIEAILIKDGKVVKPTDPKKEGYIFKGWYEGETEFDFNTKVEKNIVLTAKWALPSYKVTFNSDGGSSVTTQEIVKDAKVTEPTVPTKTGLEFVSWQLDGVNYDFNTPVTKDITLTAVWQKPDTRLTVTFNSNGGSAVAAKKVESGSKVTKPSNPTRSGYTFVEWQLNGSAYNFNTAVTKNITLTATWKVKPVTYSYSVKWEVVSGSVIGEYKMYVQRSDGKIVSGKIKVNYKEGGTDTFNVSTSGYQIVKAIVGSASVTSPTS